MNKFFFVLFLGRFDPYKYSSTHMAKVHSIVVETLMDDEENQVCGYTHINDESGLTMGHLSSWTLTDIRNMLRCIQNSTPMRHKETHFINIPSYGTKLIEFGISLLNEKLKKRILVIIILDFYFLKCENFKSSHLIYRYTKILTNYIWLLIRKFFPRNTVERFHC